MRTRSAREIPPRRGCSPNSGDDEGGEDAVAGRRCAVARQMRARMAVKKVSMSKIGQPSSSRGNSKHWCQAISTEKKLKRKAASCKFEGTLSLSMANPKEALQELIDPRLGGDYPIDSVVEIVYLAKSCTHQ